MNDASRLSVLMAHVYAIMDNDEFRGEMDTLIDDMSRIFGLRITALMLIRSVMNEEIGKYEACWQLFKEPIQLTSVERRASKKTKKKTVSVREKEEVLKMTTSAPRGRGRRGRR